MDKTYCDRCGALCTNYRVRLGLYEEHTTSTGEAVSEGYLQRQKDLCRNCRDSLEEWFGHDLRLMNEEMAEQLKRQRYAETMEPRGEDRAHP